MKKKIFTADEIIQLHHDMPGYWLLLEIIEQDRDEKATLLKLLDYSKDKENLYEWLMEDEEWDWNKKYIFVFTDPSTCDIGLKRI